MKNSPKLAENFVCKICDYSCIKKSDYDKHVLTAKHQNRTFLNKKSPKLAEKFTCKLCSKTYNARNSLWYHEQKCKIEDKNIDSDKELVMLLLKENNEFKNIIVEALKNSPVNNHNTINNILNNNSNNKTFNLNVFLNETCKDAMNIMDFVDSIKLQLSDLERVGELGYIEGISSIIIKNLNAMDVTLRPVHCTDKKRETMYIKDQDKWEKEDISKTTLHKMVRKIANKNISLIKDYKARYPDCTKSSSKYSNKYNKIVIESMGCSGETSEFEKEEKIIKRVAKEVVL